MIGSHTEQNVTLEDFEAHSALKVAIVTTKPKPSTTLYSIDLNLPPYKDLRKKICAHFWHKYYLSVSTAPYKMSVFQPQLIKSTRK